MVDLTGKLAIVTGAAQGIGRAIATALGQAGADLALLDLDSERLQTVQGDFRAAGADVRTYQVDVTDTPAVSSVVDTVMEAFGQVDILVNSAGIVSSKPFSDCSEKDYDDVLGVNLKGVFNSCRAVFPLMVARRYGKIVNIASIAGKRGGGVFGNTIYAASKGGVIALTKGLAREGGPYGVNVNAVCPGPTNTQMIAGFTGERREHFLRSVPLQRFSEPEDVANVTLFLASDLSRQLTGEISDVDGGIMMD